MRREWGYFALLLGTSLLLCLSPARITAQSATAIGALNLEAELTTSGSVRAVQTIDLIDPDSLKWDIFSSVHNLQVTADGEPVSKKKIRIRKGNGVTAVTVNEFASSYQLEYETASTLIRRSDRDQFFYRLFQQPERQIYGITARFSLPTSSAELTGNIYALSGVSGSEINVEGEQAVSYSATSAGPESLITLNASWPKEVLALTTAQELRLEFLNLESLPWLGLGLLLPLITLTVLLLLLREQRKIDRVDREQVMPQPPSTLSPLLVGVLKNRKIYPEEVVALIIDLCQRGYLVVVKKNEKFYLTKRKPFDDQLTAWEREILAQMFPGSRIANADQIEQVANQTLFSPQVRQAFSQIYQVITELRYFKENPHLTRVRHKLFALFLYFAALVGVIGNTLSGANSYLLIPLIGALLMAQAIIKLSPRLVYYSGEGLRIREQWQMFGNYLESKAALPIEQVQGQYFERYLAYAIALRVDTEWASRFDNATLTAAKPDWLVSYDDSTTLELTKQLTDFIGDVSSTITKMRGPIVG